MKYRLNFLQRFVACALAWAGVTAVVGRPVLAVPEANLPSLFDTEVRPFVEEHFSDGTFPGVAGVTLHYRVRVDANARGIVVVVGGRTEFSDKYDELFYDLRDLPVSFYTLDHRGQGLSQRLLTDPNKGYVVSFGDYVTDLAKFIDLVVKNEKHLPVVIIAHSMGGLISALYANAYPGSVRGLILCAPMLGIRTAPLPEFIARFLARSATTLGFADRYVPGGKPFDPDKPFTSNDVTRSAARFALNQRLVADVPANALGGATFGWVDQAYAGIDKLGADHSHLTMPVLLLQAGDDTVVWRKPQREICEDLPRCTLVPLAGARHEILMERDEIRNSALSRIREFIASLLGTGRGGERQ